MMLLKRAALLTGSVALLASATVGCSRCETGALVGGAIGAGIGAAVVDFVNPGTLSNLEGAGIGFVAGSLLGSLIGCHMMRADYENRIAELCAQKAELERQLKACRDENAQLKAEIERLRARIAELEAQLANCGTTTVQTTGRQVEYRVELPEEVLFEVGKAQLRESGMALLDSVATKIKSDYAGRYVNVEGHTDSQPIVYSGWRSNWELGAARALVVLHYLEDHHGIAGAQLSATTFGPFRPQADNGTPEGRQANRRSEIVVYTEDLTGAATSMSMESSSITQTSSMAAEAAIIPASSAPAEAAAMEELPPK